LVTDKKRYVLLAALLLSTVFFNPGPVQAGPAALIFNVDSTADEPDATPGDGSCASTPSNLCTLRAAVQEANALSGADTIILPAGSYTLTISGKGENLAATGDLDILESVTIQGAGTELTTLDANGVDRAWQIFSPAVVNLSGLAIQGGDSGAGLGTSGVKFSKLSPPFLLTTSA
jgi:CSLREA domain-containing protein